MSDERFHRAGRVHEGAKWIPEESASNIFDGEPDTDVPAVARIREGKHAAGVFCRRAHQRRVVGIAADDPMHRDDIGGFDALPDDREVSEHALKTIAHLPSFGFAAGSVEIGRRGIDQRRRPNAIRHQLEIESADAATDV